jgi:WD40 repeat protein
VILFCFIRNPVVAHASGPLSVNGVCFADESSTNVIVSASDDGYLKVWYVSSLLPAVITPLMFRRHHNPLGTDGRLRRRPLPGFLWVTPSKSAWLSLLRRTISHPVSGPGSEVSPTSHPKETGAIASATARIRPSACGICEK